MDEPAPSAVRATPRRGAAPDVGGASRSAREVSYLEVRLFGGVDLRWGGVPLPGLASSRRTRELLQLLIVARGESVARDELAFELWPDVPDARARASLRQTLVRAARVLPRGQEFMRKTPTSVAWNVDAPASVDVMDFDAQLRRAAAARAAGDASALLAALRAATSLYRGDIHVDVSGGRLERARVALQRDAQEALRELVALHVAADRTYDAIACCERLLELDPLDEPTYAMLMRLYEASGAPRKGLRAYERLTTVLRDEVADTPGEATAALAARLGDRVVLAGAPPPPVAEALQRLLHDVQERSRREGAQLVLLRAPAGHSLAAHVASSLAHERRSALVARAARRESALPFAAASRLLGRTLLAAAARRLDAPWSTELRRLVGSDATTSPPAATAVAPAQLDALHEALGRVLQVDRAPAALVLEDAQHVDAASASWLRWLLVHGAPGNVLVLSADADGWGPGGPLDETVQLAQRLGRASEFDAAAAVLREAGLRDERLRDARLRALSGAATRVVEALAVLGMDAEPETLRRVVALPRSEVAAALEELARGGVIDVHDEGRAVAFCSAVERDAVASRITPSTRTLLHAQAADVLRGGSMGLARHDAIVAEHLERAGRPAEAAAAWAEAGRRAASVAALDAAIAAYERAIALTADAARGAASPAAASLWRELGEVHARRLDGERARQAFDVAAEHAEGDAVALATLALRRAESYVAERAYDDALRELDLADTALRSLTRRSRRWWRAAIDVDAVRARTLYFVPDPAAGNAETRRALSERLDRAVRRHGTLAQRFEAEHAALRFRSREERYRLAPDARLRAAHAERTAIATGDARAIADARFGLGFTTLFAGDPDGAISVLVDARRLAERCGVKLLVIQSVAYLGVACRVAGRIEPLRAAQSELDALIDAATPLYDGLAHAQRAYLAYLDGDHDAALGSAGAALRAWGEYWYPFRWSALCVLIALSDGHGAAREAAAAMLRADQHRPPPRLERALERLARARAGSLASRRDEALAAARDAGWL